MSELHNAVVPSYTFSTKKKRMLNIQDKAFYENKCVEIKDGDKVIGKKIYWKCSSKRCGASAYTEEDCDGVEVVVKISRDHDLAVCTDKKRDIKSTLADDTDSDDDDHMARSVVVVKFGGSAVTDKTKLETVKEQALLESSRQLREIYHSKGASVIVVHGAGSFGHFQAKQYKLSGGGGDDWREGVVQTRRSVLRLNTLVCEALVAEGVPVAPLPPFGNVTFTAGTVNHGHRFTKKLAAFMDSGFVAVTHGDVVLDDVKRCAIMSGDKIIDCLCGSDSAVRPSSVVFLTDVAGVFNLAPSDPKAKLIPLITVKPDASFELPHIEEAAHPDVTGGMKGKLEEAAKIASRGVVVHIVQVGTVHAMTAMSGMQPEVGTTLRLEKSQDNVGAVVDSLHVDLIMDEGH